MSGSSERAKRAVQTNLAKDPEYYSKIAKQSQKSYMSKPKEERKPRGFAAMDKERVRELASKGGKRIRK